MELPYLQCWTFIAKGYQSTVVSINQSSYAVYEKLAIDGLLWAQSLDLQTSSRHNNISVNCIRCCRVGNRPTACGCRMARTLKCSFTKTFLHPIYKNIFMSNIPVPFVWGSNFNKSIRSMELEERFKHPTLRTVQWSQSGRGREFLQGAALLAVKGPKIYWEQGRRFPVCLGGRLETWDFWSFKLVPAIQLTSFTSQPLVRTIQSLDGWQRTDYIYLLSLKLYEVLNLHSW